jgi:hypothetical protein
MLYELQMRHKLIALFADSQHHTNLRGVNIVVYYGS